MAITIIREAWQTHLLLYFPAVTNNKPYTYNLLALLRWNLSCHFLHSPWLWLWCGTALQSLRRIAVITYSLLSQTTKLLFFFFNHPLPIVLWRPFNDYFKCLVICFGHQHPLCLQPDFFIVMRNVFTKTCLKCFYRGYFHGFVESFLLTSWSKLLQHTCDGIFGFNFSLLAFSSLSSMFNLCR